MITSLHNTRLAHVRKLQAQPRARTEESAFIIEGVRLAEEALQSSWRAIEVFYTDQLEQRGRDVVDGFLRRGAAVEQVSEPVMRSISQTETPQGLLAVIRMQALPLPVSLDFVLVLDGVRDPGNLGTILRTSAAARVQLVLLPPGNSDPWAPKVVRAGMGAHFRLPIQQLGWEGIRQTVHSQPAKLTVYQADAAEGVAYTQADFRSPLVLIIGGEASGAGSEAASLTDERVHIPMPGGSESLNAAIATGILLFEALRQRSG